MHFWCLNVLFLFFNSLLVDHLTSYLLLCLAPYLLFASLLLYPIVLSAIISFFYKSIFLRWLCGLRFSSAVFLFGYLLLLNYRYSTLLCFYFYSTTKSVSKYIVHQTVNSEEANGKAAGVVEVEIETPKN